MKIFLSWSGEQSLMVAQQFKEWLPCVFQSVKPFLSSADIKAGQRWQSILNSVLQDYDFGVVCITKTNPEAPWIMFESGALTKKLDTGRLVPVLCDAPESVLHDHPLSQFQNVKLDEEGMLTLVRSINTYLPEPNTLTENILGKTFEVWWPQFKEKLPAILKVASKDKKKEPEAKHSSNEVLEEVLTLVRSLARREPQARGLGLLPPNFAGLYGVPANQIFNAHTPTLGVPPISMSAGGHPKASTLFSSELVRQLDTLQKTEDKDEK